MIGERLGGGIWNSLTEFHRWQLCTALNRILDHRFVSVQYGNEKLEKALTFAALARFAGFRPETLPAGSGVDED
jgi:hypothetical protein